MSFNFGLAVVIISILVGFLGSGGNIFVLYQPFEALTIVGVGIGYFILSNNKTHIVFAISRVIKAMRKNEYSSEDYEELLAFLFELFRYTKSHSIIELEKHIESPYTSHIFLKYPVVVDNKEVVVFVCDYMRMLVLGVNDPYELYGRIEEDINERKSSFYETYVSLSKLADSLPAFGILAAVLGVINAMSSLGGSHEMLGIKIAAALMGTFFGVFFSYGIVSPIASLVQNYGNQQIKFLDCIKTGIISHTKGFTPTIAVECVRQVISPEVKPSFNDVEAKISLRVKVRKNV